MLILPAITSLVARHSLRVIAGMGEAVLAITITEFPLVMIGAITLISPSKLES